MCGCISSPAGGLLQRGEGTPLSSSLTPHHHHHYLQRCRSQRGKAYLTSAETQKSREGEQSVSEKKGMRDAERVGEEEKEWRIFERERERIVNQAHFYHFHHLRREPLCLFPLSLNHEKKHEKLI